MGRPPLARWHILSTSHVDQARTCITELFTDHRLDLVSRHTKLSATVHSRRFRNTALSVVTYGTDVNIFPTDDDRDFFALLIPMSGHTALRFEDTEVCATGDAAALISPTQSVHMRWSGDCAQLVLRIERSALEAELAELLDSRVRHPLQFESRLDTSRGPGHAVRAEADLVLSEVEEPSAPADRTEMWESLERHIMHTLLLAHRHNYTDALRREPSSPTMITRAQLDVALGLMEAHPRGARSVADVAKRANMSTRSLQRAFRHYQHTTFRDYLTDIRLRRLHQDLRAYSADAVTVSQRAARWWDRVPSSGQLAAAYRARYGVTPTDTLEN